MVSAKANALDEAIRIQDRMILAAQVEGSPFVERLVAQRNDLVRELAYEWRKPQPERVA